MHQALKAISTGLLAISVGVQAAVTITLEQHDNQVVATGSGTVNSLNGLSSQGALAAPAVLVAANGLLISTNGTGALWSGIAGPSHFGVGMGAGDTDSSGDYFVLSAGTSLADGPLLGLPSDQVPQDVHFTMVFKGQTIASLGLDAGHYTWRWGSPDDGDSVTLHVLAPAPASSPLVAWLASAGLIAVSAAISAFALRRRHPRNAL